MAKRRNENGQMRREEYEAADDDISANSFDIGFERASEDSIRKRKIVKARIGGRPPAASKPTTDAAGNVAVNSNPFGDFQGLTAPPAAASNPFAGFSGLTATGKSAGEKTDKTSNGSSVKSSGSYQEAIQRLNEAFLSFVTAQSQKNPSASWVAAVQDYVKYEAELATKHASTKPVAINETKRAVQTPFQFNATQTPPTTATSTPTASSSTSLFGGNLGGDNKNDDSTKELPNKTFSFGKKDDTFTQPVSKGFSFGNGAGSLFSSKPSSDEAEKATPAFSFGNLPKPADSAASSTAASSGWSFAPKNTANGSSGGFSFGTSNAPRFSTSTPVAEGDEEENIGREEATVIIKADSSDDDCTFEVDKAKIFEFKKDEKRWADKGVHPLKVLVSKDSKSARILVRNEIGKIVLNSALYKGMSVRPQESKGKKTGVTLALQVGSTLTQFLIKVNAARVDEFIKALEAAAKSSS